MHLLWSMTLAAALGAAAVTPRAPVQPFSLPNRDANPAGRDQEVQKKRETFTYGPGPDQSVTVFPGGTLGQSIVQKQVLDLDAEEERHEKDVARDAQAVLIKMKKLGGLKSLNDFSLLYDGEWTTSMGGLVDMSFSANYTSDLLFSMKRLTINPFSIRRLGPGIKLPFEVDNAAAKKVSTMTATELLIAGRLFYIDYSSLKSITRIQGRFSAACEAYFYIHPKSGDFLPLAIKTNEGADLVYTPADSPFDWLFAKILFGQNDVWDNPWRHYAATHLTVEIPLDAAHRCMSDNHPVLAIYKKILLNVHGIRTFARDRLFAPGTLLDQNYVFSGESACEYAVKLYGSGEGRFQANYFRNSFKSRGLVNSAFGPALKNFPFYEDANQIYSVMETFMTSFVNSYYPDAKSIAQDKELTCWFKEVQTAKSIDFPKTPGATTSTLIEILTHVAYLSGLQHQTMNNNDQFISSRLPLGPAALYKNLPTKKGMTEADIVAALPNALQSVQHISVSAAFSRPEFQNTDRTLINLFKDKDLVSRFNDKAKAAVTVYENSLAALSDKISRRTFDKNGLSQGAPFLWKALDPKVALYAMTI